MDRAGLRAGRCDRNAPGELGLEWTDTDLDEGVIHVTTARVQAGWEVVEGGPKSEAGHRRVDRL